MRAGTFYFSILLIFQAFQATLEGGVLRMASSFCGGGNRPRGTCRILGVSAGSHRPGPHLVQELYRGPQDLPPLVHLDAVELLLQSQHLRPLCSRLGELAVEGYRA